MYLFNPIDIYKIRYAINNPNAPDPNKTVQSPADDYNAPEEYDRVIANRLIDSDNNVDMQCPFEKDPDLY